MDPLRWWPTRRNVLNIRAHYNPKTDVSEKKILDRRPIYWMFALIAMLNRTAGVSGKPDERAAVTAGAPSASLRRSISAGRDHRHRRLFSLASYAVVGTAALSPRLLSVSYGVPWYVLPFIGAVIGLLFGALIARSRAALDGFYFALLTLGLNELFRVFFTTSKQFGSASGGLYGADSFISESGRR